MVTPVGLPPTFPGQSAVQSMTVVPPAPSPRLVLASGGTDQVAVRGSAVNVSGAEETVSVVQNVGSSVDLWVTSVVGLAQQDLAANLASILPWLSEVGMLSAPLVGVSLAGPGEGDVMERAWHLVSHIGTVMAGRGAQTGRRTSGLVGGLGITWPYGFHVLVHYGRHQEAFCGFLD
ncbi:hypothetical protein NDU88_004843 [Pleurodeles waltl]|uniref:Uncharacterized protein n=1 Tax=Pleurodeles waltl TaxID=8319 RepID=A0AAV7PE04_PLEWA|nr:hypothetical protein NDU88_004843 [Pleurodeles waltl]